MRDIAQGISDCLITPVILLGNIIIVEDVVFVLKSEKKLTTQQWVKVLSESIRARRVKT
tara:strand:+ start:798 stop:974 length:177 start_codon:yes stop_codon:yes gene_type:complete